MVDGNISLFEIFEREKMLLVSAIMFAGRKGLDEFLLAMNYKGVTGRKDCCLSKQEMVNVLGHIGMSNDMIEKTMEIISDTQ